MHRENLDRGENGIEDRHVEKEEEEMKEQCRENKHGLGESTFIAVEKNSL